jgi:hypothetical protein
MRGVRIALALTALACPVLAAIAVNAVSNRPPLGSAIGVAASSLGHHGTLLGEIAYIWQLYLPRLPLMASCRPLRATTTEDGCRWKRTLRPTSSSC